MRQLRLVSSALLLLPLLLAERPSHAADAGAPAGAAPAGKVVGPPEVAWKDMTKEQKGRYMKVVVNPKMKALFQEFDGATFKQFGCATCHGKDPKEHQFKMPSPDVHPLPSTPAAFQAATKANPTWPKFTQFMRDKVVPEVATLLGQPVFDFKKPEAGGFGCKNCHTLEKAK
jgi:hypothetical protein